MTTTLTLHSKTNNMEKQVRRMEIWTVELDGVGSEHQGYKLMVITSNQLGNSRSPVVTGIPLTSNVKKVLPTHCFLDAEQNGLKLDSFVCAEQIRSIDKQRLGKKVSEVNKKLVREIEMAICVSQGIYVAI